VLSALALAAPLLVACGGASDVAGGSSNVQDVVSHIPADATFASITDWGTIREQNPEIGSDSDEGLGRLLNVPTNSSLAQYARVMEDDYGWNVVADGEWDLTYANYGTDDGPVINLLKVSDSVDLDQFQTKLEDQDFSSKDVEAGTVWTTDLGALDPSHVQLSTWLVDEDERIVLAGLMPPEDSLTTDGDPSEDMQAIADEVGDATVMRLNVGESACQPVDPVQGIDPSQIQDQLEDRAGLERPIARAETWSGTPSLSPGDPGDTTATTILLFDSDDAAKSDHEARVAIFNAGQSLVTRQPYTDLVSLEDDEVSGSTSTFTFSGATSRIFQAESQRDWPFAFCPS